MNTSKNKILFLLVSTILLALFAMLTSCSEEKDDDRNEEVNETNVITTKQMSRRLKQK